MWHWRKNKKKGCLAWKTEEEKVEYFRSLAEFSQTDKDFFEEQYCDLLPHERREFGDWVMKDVQQKQTIKASLDLIEKLLKEKMAKHG